MHAYVHLCMGLVFACPGCNFIIGWKMLILKQILTLMRHSGGHKKHFDTSFLFPDSNLIMGQLILNITLQNSNHDDME